MDSFSVPIHLVRQWCFCPRVIYYQELLGIKPEKPLWVSQGEQFHKENEKREKRRTLSRYQLPEGGKRHYRVEVKNDVSHGIVDSVIETGEEILVVEYKLNPQPKKAGHRLQLAAYAVAAERVFGKKCEWGYLTGKNKKTFKIHLNPRLKDKSQKILSKITETLELGIKPPSGATSRQCGSCEYLNFCNDRL